MGKDSVHKIRKQHEKLYSEVEKAALKESDDVSIDEAMKADSYLSKKWEEIEDRAEDRFNAMLNDLVEKHKADQLKKRKNEDT